MNSNRMQFVLLMLLASARAFHYHPISLRQDLNLNGAFFEEQLPLHPASSPASPPNPTSSSTSNDERGDMETRANNKNEEEKRMTQRRRFLGRGMRALAGTSVLMSSSSSRASAFDPISFFSPVPTASASSSSPIVYSDDSIMEKKEHGTTSRALDPSKLQYNVDPSLANKICSFNRHFAEPAGSFENNESFMKAVASLNEGETLTFYDSVYNTPLFTAPVGRSKDEFLQESYKHGWPSFRDSEVNWSNVRVLKSTGETVSVGGTHLGHNLPDKRGARYCINLVSVAGSKA